MDINQRLTEELDVKRWQIDAAVQLIDEGNTIPFISRYRKEATGELNDEQLRKLYERLVYLRNLEEKKEQVISSIEEQGKLTEELKKQILAAETLVAVEDLYRPYRPKRRTRAMIAKEKGLEAFALTEHAPQMPGTCHEFYFQNLHIVPREMYGVRLFMGVELNIMNEKGEIDLPESTLCQMDIAIASIHGPCYKGERTEEAITAAYLAAMENPLIHIIGHPDDGRYPVDYEQLAKKAKETGTILEVNNGSLRPGGFRVDTRKNDLKMLEYCKKYEVLVTMGSDAHMDVDLADYSYALPVIEESHFPEELIVNTSAELLKSCIQYKRNMWKQKKVNC